LGDVARRVHDLKVAIPTGTLGTLAGLTTWQISSQGQRRGRSGCSSLPAVRSYAGFPIGLRARLGRNLHPGAGIVDSSHRRSLALRRLHRWSLPTAKVRGRKRHLLVDTEGLVPKAKGHSAKVPDQDGIKLLLEAARGRLPHLWVDAGYQRRDKDWAEQVLGLSVEVVHRIPKLTPEKLAHIWA
jgi:hypothetical protein